MDGNWKLSRFKLHLLAVISAFFFLGFCCNFSLCLSLNSQGLVLLRFKARVISDPYDALASWKYLDGYLYPCSWYGVRCSDDGEIISLELSDLCLEGTLDPELGQLTHLKSLILRNNSFSGIIPKQIGELEELEILDLGYNNFSGPFPSDIGNNLSLSILLLDSNKYISCIPPEILYLPQLHDSSATSACCNRLSKSRKVLGQGDTALRRFLNERKKPPPSALAPVAPSPVEQSPSPSPSPSQSPPPSPTPAPSAWKTLSSVNAQEESSPTPAAAPSTRGPKKSNKLVFVLVGAIGGSTLLVVSVLYLLYCRNYKVVTVRPWATGLSGQLQKAFVTGVPKLQRSELEIACEDFSNVVGALCDGTVYKGTLSSGVEIAVTSTAVKSAKDWSKNSETQFRNKIDTLSKINHKNFVNLIGYCEEEVPFTRMMVFEYAPNGTLFDHLHFKESEHLDWNTRLRIAMGIAYCLEYMHQLRPPIAHWNLHSSSIYLTEDYAAKISDFSIWNEVVAAKMGSANMNLLETPSVDPESNVYNFGVILLEMITGRLPFSGNEYSLADWAVDYFRRGRPLTDMVDPTLRSFRMDDFEELFELVKCCLNPNPEERPRMTEIVARLKERTSLSPDGATPKSSPLWWAEVEILSNA